MAGPNIVIEGVDQSGRPIKIEIDEPQTYLGGYVLCTVSEFNSWPIQPIVLPKYKIKQLVLELIKTL